VVSSSSSDAGVDEVIFKTAFGFDAFVVVLVVVEVSSFFF
jgi:hypothetical protein